ncbi:MAG TPA: Fe-S cluster assembly protein SufD [Chthoniobacterales bacterium]|nr:Fe-S cluster assembly protein SufD [Chthoniobacterales bacterium]
MSYGSAVLEDVTGSPEVNSDIVAAPQDAAGDLPAWFRQQRGQGWREFSALPMPTRKDQAWRFSNVGALDLTPYRFGTVASDDEQGEILERSTALNGKAGRLVFANDQLLERDILPESLRKAGVIFQPLERALAEHEDLVRKHFMAQPAALGSAKFAALHRARVLAGAFIYVPRGLELELPIEIFHWLIGENAAAFPHLLLVADEMAKVTVIEHFRSFDKTAHGFACGVNDLIAGPGATVKYVCAQRWNENVTALQINATTVERDASAMSLNLHLGGNYSRFESLSRMVGEGARSDLLAVAVAHEKQEFDARTLQDHVFPHTASDLLYKNALTDRARTTFGGLIRVEPHAHFTDAYQKVRNLLLSDDAEANSMPGLEILADNVRCTHGATSGQIDEDELFYLRTRGIPIKTAQRLIVGGFLTEVIQRLDEDTIAAHLNRLIEEKFATDR